MSYRDDYNRAVFLNAYGSGKPVRNNDKYQRYLEFECGIIHPQRYHKDLIKTGYLQPSSVKDTISALNVSELKTICDSIGISKTGKKQDLVNRIISSCHPEQIYSFVEDPLYSLSEKGASFMNEHEDYIKLHKHKGWCIELDEYVTFKQSLPFSGKFEDVAWGIFNKRVVEYARRYGLLRNNYLNMSYLAKSEKDSQRELKYLLYVLFLDICGVDAFEHLEYCGTKKEAADKYDCFGLKTSIPSEISSLKEYYDDSYISEIYSRYKNLPLNLCDIETFKHLIADMFNNCETVLEKYEKIFRDNYQQYIDNRFDKSSKKISANSPQKSGGCLTSVLTFCLLICFLIYHLK